MVIKTLESALADLKDSKDASAIKARESLTVLLAKAKEAVEAAKADDKSDEKKGEEAAEEAADKPADKKDDEPAPDADKDAPEGESEEAKAAKKAASEAEEKSKEAAGMYEKGHAMVAKALAMGHKPPKAEEAAAPSAEAVKADEDEKKESKRLAIAGLLKESGVADDMVDLAALCEGSLKDAKTHIASVKKVSESLTKTIIRKLEIPAGHAAKGAAGTSGDSNQTLFSGLVGK